MIQRASVKCKQSPVYGVFDRYFHIPLPIVTKHELGLPFPLEPSHKIWYKTVHIFLVIVVTDRYTNRHTHKHTNAGETYSLAFAGIITIITVYVTLPHTQPS